MNIREEAAKLVGVPYKNHGRDESGCDCYGVAILLFGKTGRSLPDYQYSPDWYEKGYNHYLEHYHECAEEIRKMDLREGDIILFRNAGSRVPNHLGIYLGDSQFLQCLEKTGVVISSLNRQPFNRTAHSYYRLVEKESVS